MFHVCPGCGLFNPERQVDPEACTARCPACNHLQPFVLAPLFVVTGASGTGKSTACQHLVTECRAQDFVILDSDVLWMEEFHPSAQWPRYFDAWLRLAWNINQSGRPLILFGSGIGVPENLVSCTNRRYFSEIRYLALVCDGQTQAARLGARPAWRGQSDPDAIARATEFNRWFQEEGPSQSPPIALLDTSRASVSETAERILRWARG